MLAEQEFTGPTHGGCGLQLGLLEELRDLGHAHRVLLAETMNEKCDVDVQVDQSAIDERWEQRSAAMEHRLTATSERGLREAITSQTRVVVVSLLVSVVAVAGVAFGLSG